MRLDTRLIGRDQQIASPQDPALAEQNHKLLGNAQAKWLLQSLSKSKDDNILGAY